MLVAYLPEVLYDRVAFGVSAVISVLLPVVDIDVCYATDEQLELTLVEDVDEISGNELVEALNKGVKLFINTLLNAPFCNESGSPVSKSSRVNVAQIANLLDVFLLVLIRHLDVPTTFLEVHDHLLTESLIVNREG
jgi:hypothetical protein